MIYQMADSGRAATTPEILKLIELGAHSSQAGEMCDSLAGMIANREAKVTHEKLGY